LSYIADTQSPLKNALMGSLVRTLLIQVQKTKTDLSLSLLSLDHLLRSQQLTFAFVGVAPSFLILYGLGGYLRSAWKGEKRGKTRRRRYFNGLRDVERILLTAPEEEQQMTQRDRGLLIVSVSGMRTWAAGLGSSREVSHRRATVK
jgi:nuclear-control-of-ATPase protein 2